jgi:glycosyltransferase involved in cell wall biosynthesis
VLSDFSKNKIIDDLKIDTGKIDVVYTGVGEFKPIIFMEREKIKEQYSQGNEYFLVWRDCYNQKNLYIILKAFSGFKKWQKSSMQLLIVAISSLRQEDLQMLSLFKYAEDVKILKDSTELPGITASAYAVVDFSYNESFGVHCLEAMKCHVPVITYHDGAIPEICADAALYTAPGEYNGLAEKMMMIFKDEKLRDELIEKGKKRVRKYNWQKTAELFWESILKATG